MAVKALCASLLLATGSFANFPEIQSEIPDGLSAACNAAAIALEENALWDIAEFQTSKVFDFMCQTELVMDFFVGHNVRRCTSGSELITAEAREQYAIISEANILQRITRVSDGAFQFAVTYFWDGIPRECTAEDYEIYEQFISSYVEEQVAAQFPAAEYTSEVDVFLFVNDRGLPANYGDGYQTLLTVQGNTPTQDSVWTVACNECSPAWSVDVFIPGMQGSEPDVAIITATNLNADANFDAAGCKAIYAQLDGNVNQYGEASDNLNVFCPDNADITIQVNDGTVQAITSFEYDGEVQSGPLTLTGNRVAFDSGSTTDVARTTSSASVAAPALLVAAVALVSSAFAL